MTKESFLFLILLVLCGFMLPGAGNAGDPYIQLNKEQGGDLDKGARAEWDGVYENQNGAMVWNGSQWVINNTWAHTYFTDKRTGLRLVDHSVLATFDGTGTGGVVGAYVITQNSYNYCVPAASEGPAYCYEAVGYKMVQPDGKKILLRSRGSGNGTGQAYFNIYIEDPDGGATTALRGDPVLFVYTGMTPEQAAEETNDTEGAAANLPTVTPTERAQYWMDINGGSDMSGYTYHLTTGAISALTENLGASFPTFFDVQYYDESDNEVKEIHFLPRILTETREGVAAERWLKAYGKSGEDLAASLQTTADKGYMVVGKTTSSGAGGSDLWVLKLGSGGAIQWKRTYGGASGDAGAGIEQTPDGGFIVVGSTESFGAGGSDVWVLKLGPDGKIQWQQTYGGSGRDEGVSIQVTRDGGYIVGAVTESFGAGGSDAWLLKLRANGKIQWQKTYGGAGDDGCAAVREIRKAGYIVCGHTESFGAGGSDLWVLKLGGDGKVVWQKTCGGAGDERGASIQQTREGGYLAGAGSASFVTGSTALWVLKLASNGNAQWQKAYTNSGDSYGCLVRQTLDDGYIVAGDTSHCGAGGVDALVLKLASDGKIQWQKTYGGAVDDFGRLLAQATDGGYVVGGDTHSFGAGSPNAWVAYIGKDGKIPGCPAVGASSSKVRGTQATIQNTPVTGKNTSAAPKASTAKSAAASSTVTAICTESQ